MPSARFKLVVAALAVATVAVFVAEPYLGAQSNSQFRPAPAFELPTVDGTTFNLSTHRGAPVLLDFMAVWCPPCRETMGTLRMVRGANDPAELVIASIDVDYTESAADLRQFREQFAGYNVSAEPQGWFFALDSLGAYVGARYGASALPTLVLVDSAGFIRHTWSGSPSAAEIQTAIDGVR